MKIVGCDLHAKQQAIAMVDTETGEFSEKTLSHEGTDERIHRYARYACGGQPASRGFNYIYPRCRVDGPRG